MRKRVDPQDIKAALRERLDLHCPDTDAWQIPPAECEEAYLVDEALEKWDIRDEGVLYEEKMDGLRYLFQTNPHGADQNYLTSKRISKVTKRFVEKQDKCPLMRDHKMPPWMRQCVFDGEIFSPGISSDTVHAMARGNVEYFVWDIIVLRGKPISHWPLKKRLAKLRKLAKFFPKWMKMIPVYYDHTFAIGKVRQAGGEGIVRKKLDDPYGWGWAKAKEEITEDVVIIGYEDSKSDSYQPKGWIQNVCFAQFVPLEAAKKLDPKGKRFAGPPIKRNGDYYVLFDVGKTSGMDEKQRANFSAEKEEFMHEVMEITAQLRLPSGKFRHPRYERMRYDKNAKDCIWTPKS